MTVYSNSSGCCLRRWYDITLGMKQMRNRRRLLLASTLFLLMTGMAAVWSVMPAPVTPPTTWQASPASGPLARAPIRNFGMVERGILYRSAQPHPLAWPWLRRLGIRSVVNLREQQYDDGAWALSAMGFTSYLQVPIDNYEPPTDAQAIAFLQFVGDRRNWPVLVHCAEGKGRTGVLVALARYQIDGWSLDQALAEADSYTAKSALSRTQREWLAQWARTHAPGDAETWRQIID